MTIIIIAFLGLCLGSFVNALVYRLHEQSKNKRKSKVKKQKTLANKDLSILHGRSMCPDCHHTLSASDLIPVLSWIGLGGKCRYCHKPISWQYPLVELITAVLFVTSYAWWPQSFDARGIINFVVWCLVLVGFMALLIYDLRWMLLPNRIIYPLVAITGVLAVFNLFAYHGGIRGLGDIALSITIASGLFYALFEYSKGKWIGGGDVKLGLVIGLCITVPIQAFLVLFLASLLGTIVTLPSLLSKKLKATSHIPFGPFLIIATIIVRIFGASVVAWYRKKFLLF